MPSNKLLLILIICLFTCASRAADDPFVGKWKVNPAKSKLTDELKIEAAGANRFKITFGPGESDTIVADGSDQPGLDGTTLSITINAPNSWTVVRKKEARILLSAEWTLSDDGRTLTDVFKGYHRDGSTLSVHFVYQRKSGTSGFSGTWVTESEQVESVIELKILPEKGDGLSIYDSESQVTRTVKFDGKDYPSVDSNGARGLTASSRRLNKRSLEITHKLEGRITDTQLIEISPDFKTLTLSVFLAGETRPRNLLVFDRE